MRRVPHSARAILSLLVAALALTLVGCGGTAWSTRADSTSPQAPDPLAPVVSGPTFADPQGRYTITVAPGWVSRPGAVQPNSQAWLVGPLADGIAPNVIIAIEGAPGLDLAGYLAYSLKQGPQLAPDFHSVGVHTIAGVGGQSLGTVDYTASTGGRRFHFFAVVFLHNGQAVVATLTALDDGAYAALQARVAPYLETLQST